MKLALGHLLVALAALEVIVAWAVVRRLPADSPPERVKAGRILLGASVAGGFALCLVVLLVPSFSEPIRF